MSDGASQSDSGSAVQPAARVERSADGPGGSGGGGSGGGGVGVSTGTFDNQTHYRFLGGWLGRDYCLLFALATLEHAQH